MQQGGPPAQAAVLAISSAAPDALTCPTGPREPAAPLPARAAGVARPGGGCPGAAAVGSPVDGPVSTAGSVPVTGGEEGLVHTLCEGLRQGAPGDPDGTHPAARPVDVLCAPCCQHQAPQQKQLPGAPHGPCLLAGRPSQGGLETGAVSSPGHWELLLFQVGGATHASFVPPALCGSAASASGKWAFRLDCWCGQETMGAQAV